MKKILASLLTFALLIGCIGLIPVSAEDTAPASYHVSFSPLPVVAVYNATPVSTEIGTKVYIDYSVNSSVLPAFCCFASVPNPSGIWPFASGQGSGTCLYSSANQAIICQPGYTYHMVYEVIEDGFTFYGTYVDAEGNTYEWQGDTYLAEPMPAAGQPYAYGGYVGITAFNGDSSMDMNIKFTDENGNDLGVMSNRGEVSITASDTVIPSAPAEDDATIPDVAMPEGDVLSSAYKAEFSGLSVAAIYNSVPVSTEIGTKVYIDYYVNSSELPAWCCFVSVPNPSGVWPFNNAQGAGAIYYSSENQAIICQPGYTYHIVYEVIEGGFTFYGAYTDTEGVTHQWRGDSYLSEPMPGAGESFPYGAYVGITAFNGDSSMSLNIKFTDEEGNDLGVMSNRAEANISAPNLNVTYMIGGENMTDKFASSNYTFDPLVGLPASALPTYIDTANNIRVVEWYYDADLTQLCTGIEAGATENVTLYGKVVGCTYTIIYNANGGEGTMEDQVVELNATFNLSANAYTMEGKTFLGWGYFNDDTTPAFTDGQEVSALANKHDAKVYLYAIWGDASSSGESDITTAEPTETTEPGDVTEPDTTVPDTDDVTAEPTTGDATEADTTASDTTEEPTSGCSSVVAASATALLMAVAAAVVLRKKD